VFGTIVLVIIERLFVKVKKHGRELPVLMAFGTQETDSVNVVVAIAEGWLEFNKIVR
jgi:hypothetical protein